MSKEIQEIFESFDIFNEKFTEKELNSSIDYRLVRCIEYIKRLETKYKSRDEEIDRLHRNITLTENRLEEEETLALDFKEALVKIIATANRIYPLYESVTALQIIKTKAEQALKGEE